MYVYVDVDGIYLRRNWGEVYKNVAILVAIAVNEKGYREVLGADEGMKEDKARAVVAQLREMKLKEVTQKMEDSVEEMLTCCDFPSVHWIRIRTNNVIERLNREIRRRTHVVGTFPDGNSALMLVCARLCHVADTQWGNKKNMNIKHLQAALNDISITG